MYAVVEITTMGKDCRRCPIQLRVSGCCKLPSLSVALRQSPDGHPGGEAPGSCNMNTFDKTDGYFLCYQIFLRAKTIFSQTMSDVQDCYFDYWYVSK